MKQQQNKHTMIIQNMEHRCRLNYPTGGFWMQGELLQYGLSTFTPSSCNTDKHSNAKCADEQEQKQTGFIISICISDAEI